ncbi:unnamed protein product [Sphenostylis stenocarpa]|uniref:Uncharacterized protein n=1 Tax=Sphenostylis stenocarpa TaxID=92480 RepID=A0AA86T1W1_9FABA|nr:unnamed protein product [Sphenostylis stenocarpa]
MEVVGKKPKVARLTLLVLMTIPKVASVHLDSGEMESNPVKMWMNAKKNWPANAQNANAKILGEVTNAHVVMFLKGKYAASVGGGGIVWMVILILAIAGAGGYAFYKYRIRRYMDSEIRAIMAQYMPLDNQPETSSQVRENV